MNEIKKIIIEKGNSFGFPIIKFAKEQLLSKEIEYLKKWISLGYYAGMDYMQRNIDARENTKLLLENTKTIIVFAYPYPSRVKFNGKLKIAKYAVVTDYHTTIRAKLNTISEFLFNKYHINSKCFVDSAPILEKQWAIKSGLGWQGKNSLIINSILGSYFHIGIMLIDVELEADQQLQERCGDCNLCIKSCPTQAIVSEKIVDCRKCLAKHTIEKNAELSSEIKTAIKDTGYIFGCDICQDVCPYNQQQTDQKLHYNLLNDIKNITENDFNHIFQHYPLIRTGYQRILEYISLIND